MQSLILFLQILFCMVGIIIELGAFIVIFTIFIKYLKEQTNENQNG